MRVFLFNYSYHKSKWSGRINWPTCRIIAESLKDAEKTFYSKKRGAGFRLESVEDVTGIPHHIPKRTVF